MAIQTYVVMGNDFPDSVWADLGDADAYCKAKMEAQKDPKRPYLPARIYWRVYPFPLLPAGHKEGDTL